MRVSASNDAVEELLATVSQHCANVDYCIFWGETNHPVRERCSYKAMDRQVRELIIYQFGTPVPSECEALRDFDLQNAYFQQLTTQYMSSHYISTTVAPHIESTTREQSKNSLWHQLHNGRSTGFILVMMSTIESTQTVRSTPYGVWWSLC